MKTKLVNKIVSAILIFVITFSYWGVLAEKAYAEYEELESQEVKTNNKNVEFDVYFKENEQNTHTKIQKKSEEGSLYVNFNVKEGYLKQIKIKLDNPNFSMKSEELDISNNEISIEWIEGQNEIGVIFGFEKQELISADYFSKETSIILSAVYIDTNGKEKDIEAERKIMLTWEEEVVVESEQQIEKTINLGENRYLLQTNLKIRIKDNAVPVENIKMEILNPVIENTTVEKVDIYAVNTIIADGTNNNFKFSDENLQYNGEEGKLDINLTNPRNNENKIVWKDGENEFKLIYILNALDGIIENKGINLEISGSIYYAENREINFANKLENQIVLSGKLIDVDYTITEGINKGYMYAKTEETGYETRQVVEISYSDLVEYIDIEMGKDRFVDEAGNRIETNGTIYKRTKINKVSFDSIFGEEGRIEVYGNGEKVGEITKDSVADEEGNVVIEYGEEVGEVLIKTSKPIAEGKIEIINDKAVKGELRYSREEIQRLKWIETGSKVRTNITEEEKTVTMELRETVSKAEISMLTEKVSTVIKNERVEIKVLLRTDSNAYDLYKNPYLEIELPIEVKEVEVESIAAAFGEGFKINWTDIIETEEGKKVIRIALIGEQERYAIDISEGTSIVIRTKMTLDKKSGSKEEVVKLRYRNENAIGYDNNGEAEGKIEIEAPTGVVAINSMEGYNEEGDTATSLSSKEEVGELEILTEKKTAKVSIDVINNYEGEIENPRILGRVPAEGNKKVTGEELGSTFTANMVEGIEKTEGLEGIGYKIYYSSNGEATEDTEKEENGWKETIEEAGEVKSYLIETEGYKMGQGESMSFEYEVEIPEGLNHNESSYSTYAVDYGIEEEGNKRVERIIAPTVGATTGEGPELEVSLESNVENNGEVQEGQIIKYNVKVKNVGDIDAKNILISTIIPENTSYYSSNPAGELQKIRDEDNRTRITKLLITKDSIAVGETFVATISLKVGILPSYYDENEEIKMNVSSIITADDLGKELTTNECVNRIVKGNLSIELQSEFGNGMIFTEGTQLRMSATIKNINSDPKENVVFTYKVPEGFEYIEAYRGGHDTTGVNYDEQTRILTINIGNMNGSESLGVIIVVSISPLEGDVYERQMVSVASVIADGMEKEKISNEIIHTSGRAKLVVTQSSNRDYEVNAGDKIEYYIKIENQGSGEAKEVKLIDYLPKELKYCSLTYTIDGKAVGTEGYINEENNYEIMFNVPIGSEVVVTLIAEALKQSTSEVEVTNSGVIINNKEEINMNSLTHKIISDNSVLTPGGDRVNVYNISGVAWEDVNKDGQKGSNENRLSNIQVILIDNETGNIALQASTSKEQRTTTNSSGQYEFKEVKAGEYIVVFLYDQNQYTITEYKKEGVLENDNSDAISALIKIDGQSQMAGITESIQITESSILGVNIGLIKMESAIFSINKVVTRMSMTNPKTSKTVDFNNSKLAKMDADGKYINSTNFVIEYKLSVTNEGSVPGYVKRILDKVPNGFKFSSDLNPNWYLGNNGEIYNTSLANTTINPGETKDVSLVLTKQMTENGNGIFHNTAEITEVYNEYGLENRIREDTTQQAADVLIGIKTGGGIVYISIIMIAIGLLVVGIYFINKKVLKKNTDNEITKIDNIEI